MKAGHFLLYRLSRAVLSGSVAAIRAEKNVRKSLWTAWEMVMSTRSRQHEVPMIATASGARSSEDSGEFACFVAANYISNNGCRCLKHVPSKFFWAVT